MSWPFSPSRSWRSFSDTRWSLKSALVGKRDNCVLFLALISESQEARRSRPVCLGNPGRITPRRILGQTYLAGFEMKPPEPSLCASFLSTLKLHFTCAGVAASLCLSASIFHHLPPRRRIVVLCLYGNSHISPISTCQAQDEPAVRFTIMLVRNPAA